MKGELVREVKVWRRRLKGRVNVVRDDIAFQQSGKNWCNGNRPVVGWESGVGVLGIGRIEAAFHCLGTMDDDSDRFIMLQMGPAKNGAPIRRNQAGMLSNPVAVSVSVE